jgi:type IV secretion system protein VirB6
LITLAVVFGGAVRLWLYNSLLVDTFYRAPAELAGAIVGAQDPVATIDTIWERGGAVAGYLWNNGGVFSGDFGYYVAGAVVWTLMGLLCVYTMFLIALSGIALAVLLALGPLFITLLLFDSTRRFFEAWLAQLANYALITILTVLVAALLLQVVESYAVQTAARGTAIATVDALNMVLVAVLVFLLLRQVMPIASGLAGGIALSSFGTLSRFVSWGMRRSMAGGSALVALGAASLSGTGPLAAQQLRIRGAVWHES